MRKKCWVCGRKFRDDQAVVPVGQYVVNNKRGDFVGQATEWACADHLKEGWLAARAAQVGGQPK